MEKAAGNRGQQGGGGQRRKTRERILEMARELFNEQGEANVTLAQIGERLGISEGNVWYHFHTKQDVIFALFTELQTHIKANQQRNLDDLRQLRRPASARISPDVGVSFSLPRSYQLGHGSAGGA